MDIRHVANIARLKLTESEIKKFEPDLNEILNAFKALEKIKPKCKPSFQPIEIKNITREDEPEKGLTQEEALLNAEHKEKGFFKGPRVM